MRHKETGKNVKPQAKKKLRVTFFSRPEKSFDRVKRKSKRSYQLLQQERLHNMASDVNSREFWKHIGKLGMSNGRKRQFRFETAPEDGSDETNLEKVLDRWKSDYSGLFNSANVNNGYDEEFLHNIQECINNGGPDINNDIDISDLNAEITKFEVEEAVYRAKCKKAVGLNEIPSDMLRNETCVDLLYRIIKYCFEECQVPQEWMTCIITSVPKPNADPLTPLSYRPISLISIPCKIYADILNRRLTNWLETNDLLAEERNCFRKERTCIDHLYTLTSLIKNRKIRKKQTFVCFIDAKKAFDSVNRDMLWYKLMTIGVYG